MAEKEEIIKPLYEVAAAEAERHPIDWGQEALGKVIERIDLSAGDVKITSHFDIQQAMDNVKSFMSETMKRTQDLGDDKVMLVHVETQFDSMSAMGRWPF